MGVDKLTDINCNDGSRADQLRRLIVALHRHPRLRNLRLLVPTETSQEVGTSFSLCYLFFDRQRWIECAWRPNHLMKNQESNSVE